MLDMMYMIDMMVVHSGFHGVMTVLYLCPEGMYV